MHELLVRRVAEDVGQCFGQLDAVERRQVDPPRALEALELGEQWPQRVTAMQLVAPVGEQEHHALLSQAAGDELGEGPGGAVRPVHVFENERERTRVAQEVEQLQHRLEQPKLARRIVLRGRWAAVAERRQQRRELCPAARAEGIERRMVLSDEWPQCAEQRRVRELALAVLDAFASENERVLVGDAALELADEASLSDP